MLVGELNDGRDFLDADDVVRIYVGIPKQGRRLSPRLVLIASSSVSRRIGGSLQRILAASQTTASVKVVHRGRQRLRTSPRPPPPTTPDLALRD